MPAVGLRTILGAAAIAAATRAPAAAANGACAKTTEAARRACEHEVHEDLWIAMGLCANVPDAAARRACRRTAKQDAREAAAECREQEDARDALCDALGEAPYAPAVDPARFLAPADVAASPNPFFPLVPGNTWVYAGGDETVTVTVTERTKTILGVTCVVVRDVVEAAGAVVEDTDDYFAQDVDGTVWYFGELSRSFEAGELADLEGSWVAGVDGARPGTIMKAAPAVGETYRQEFALGDAEDAAEVLSVTATAVTPAATCDGTCVLTRDFTPLEPDVEERKYYAPGIGLVLEEDVETGARVELVAFTAG